MKKETLIWQIIALVLGLFLIFTIKTHLENKILIEAMKNTTDTMTNRANCFAIVEEKNLNDAYCKDIDTSAYKLLENIKTKY